MTSPKPTIGVIGLGRAGGALIRAWRRAGYRVVAVGRGQRLSRLRRCDAIGLAVPDGRVHSVAAALAQEPWVGEKLVFHLAGSLGLDVLADVKAAGARTGSLHPLLAIPRRAAEMQGAYAAIAGARTAKTALRQLAVAAGLKPLSVAPEPRAAYHLGASLGANSIPVVLESAVRELTRAGLREAEARHAIHRLASSALEAWRGAGGVAGLTGPVARGDVSTVRLHLRSLRTAASRDLYQALAVAAVELLGNRLPPKARRELRALLAHRQSR